MPYLLEMEPSSLTDEQCQIREREWVMVISEFLTWIVKKTRMPLFEMGRTRGTRV